MIIDASSSSSSHRHHPFLTAALVPVASAILMFSLRVVARRIAPLFGGAAAVSAPHSTIMWASDATQNIIGRPDDKDGSSPPLPFIMRPMNVPTTELNEIERCLPASIVAAHQRAVENGEPTYEDPDTGYTVFTRNAHAARGRCCGSRCRHCPYLHINVPKETMDAARSMAAAAAAAAATTAPSPKSTPAPNSLRVKVYTKKGDGGTSTIVATSKRPTRLSKSDPIFDALGTIDELSSQIGVAVQHCRGAVGPTQVSETQRTTLELPEKLFRIQSRLITVGSIVASPGLPSEDGNLEPLRTWTKELERDIDILEAALPPLSMFIVPGGSMAAAQLHVCRSVCRRAERCLVSCRDANAEANAAEADSVSAPPAPYNAQLMDAVIAFTNRLSDFFYTSARAWAPEDPIPRR